jgi:hypothetical protein
MWGSTSEKLAVGRIVCLNPQALTREQRQAQHDASNTRRAIDSCPCISTLKEIITSGTLVNRFLDHVGSGSGPSPPLTPAAVLLPSTMTGRQGAFTDGQYRAAISQAAMADAEMSPGDPFAPAAASQAANVREAGQATR